MNDMENDDLIKIYLDAQNLNIDELIENAIKLQFPVSNAKVDFDGENIILTFADTDNQQEIVKFVEGLVG